jgi:16S rRNA processing protein RimM
LTNDGPSHPVQFGFVQKAQGLLGEIAARLFNPDSPLWRPGTQLWLKPRSGPGRWVEVVSLRKRGEGAVLRLAGVATRTEAEALVGAELSVDRSALPPAGEQEVYLADLVGMQVQDAAGVGLGKVVGLERGGKQDFLVVEDGAKRELLPLESTVLAKVEGGIVTLGVQVESEVPEATE